MKHISRLAQEKISDITSTLGEIFNNIEIIKANSTEKFEAQRFEEDNKLFFNLNMKAVKTSELVSPIMETLGSIGVVVVIIMGGTEVIDGKLSVGSFFSFLTALFMLYTPVKRISSALNQMQDAVAASERIFYLMDLNASIKGGEKALTEDISDITFENVSLSYGKAHALHNINLHAKKGDVIALVGDSGGGKSSLVNLLVRFYDPDNGKVLFNTTDIKDYTLKSLRDTISMVTQRVYIFNKTVAENVAYGQTMDESRVIQSLQDANAMAFINSLDEGIHTVLQEFGANLSGGQRQRIAIARAFYKNPKILILDEATSALDNKSEKEIGKALEKLQKGRITFMIAHRLSTVEHADKLIVLKGGEVMCEGSDKILLDSCEEYQKLKNTYV